LLAVAASIAGAGPVEAGGGGYCRTQAISENSGVEVDVSGFCFEPTVLNVGVGQAITWTNRDAAPHTVTGANGAWGDSERFGLDETVSFTFDEPGTYPYVCLLHPSMAGTVVVSDGGASIGSVSAAGVGPAAPLTIASPATDTAVIPPLVWVLLGAIGGVVATGAGSAALRRLMRRSR
jgi:plastocyanin